MKRKRNTEKGTPLNPPIKSPTSAYFLYYQDECVRLRALGTKGLRNTISNAWRSMSADDKAVYENRYKTAYNEYIARLGGPTEKKPKTTKSTLVTKLSVKSMLKLVKRLSTSQKKAISEIGFGGLLDLKCAHLNLQLCEWLVKNFNPTTCTLNVHGRKLLVTPSDMERILGLRADGGEVPSTEDLEEIEIEPLCTKYGLVFNKGCVSLKLLKEKLFSTTDDGDSFKAQFALFALRTIYCPTTKTSIHTSSILKLSDIARLGSLNWAKYMLDKLVSGISVYKNNKNQGIRGCLLFLMLFYLDACTPIGDTLPTVRPVPSISFRGNEQIATRMKSFEKMGGFDSKKVELVSQLVDEARPTTDGLAELIQLLESLQRRVEALEGLWTTEFLSIHSGSLLSLLL